MILDELKLIFYYKVILKIFFASITSKTLFIMVAESIEIFFPIFQFGCFKASFNFNFIKFIFW